MYEDTNKAIPILYSWCFGVQETVFWTRRLQPMTQRRM